MPVLKANGAVSKLWVWLADAPHVWAMRRRCNMLKIIDFVDCAWRAAGADRSCQLRTDAALSRIDARDRSCSRWVRPVQFESGFPNEEVSFR